MIVYLPKEDNKNVTKVRQIFVLRVSKTHFDYKVEKVGLVEGERTFSLLLYQGGSWKLNEILFAR